MQELVADTVDAAKEKHVPVIIKDGNKVTVKVGEVPHPMTKEHYILFVELLVGDKVLRHDFKEGDTVAEAIFVNVVGEAIEAVRNPRDLGADAALGVVEYLVD